MLESENEEKEAIHFIKIRMIKGNDVERVWAITESERDYAKVNNDNSFDEIGYAILQNKCIFSELEPGDLIPFITQGESVPICRVANLNMSEVLKRRKQNAIS